jgi:hypothetical protein
MHRTAGNYLSNYLSSMAECVESLEISFKTATSSVSIIGKTLKLQKYISAPRTNSENCRK